MLLLLVLLLNVLVAVGAEDDVQVSLSTLTPHVIKPHTLFGSSDASNWDNLELLMQEYYEGMPQLRYIRQLPKITDAGGHRYTAVWLLEQLYKGLPVRGTSLKVVFDGTQIVQASGKLLTDIAVDVEPAVSTTEAAAKARWVAKIKAGNHALSFEVKSTSLCIFRNGLSEGYVGTNSLAWDVRVHSTDDDYPFKYSVLVDAHDGQIREVTPLVMDAMYRELRKYPETVAYWKEGDPEPGDYDSDSFISAAGDYYTTLLNMFDWESYDNRDSPLVGNTYMNTSICPNAYFDPENNMTWFCTGLSRFDIATHELGHALTSALDNGIYEYASGALQEAFSDTIAETFSQFWNGSGYYPPRNPDRSCVNTLPDKRWICGDDCEVFNDGLRDLYNPTCYDKPESVATMVCYPYDNEGVHTNCGPPSVLYAVLADGGTYAGIKYNGIGLLKAWHIFFQAKYYYQQPTETFAEYASHLNRSCVDILGVFLKDQYGQTTTLAVTTEDCATLNALITAVGMSTPPCTTYTFWGAYPSYIPMSGTSVTVITESLSSTVEYMIVGNTSLVGLTYLWNPYGSAAGWNQHVDFNIPAFASLGNIYPATNVHFLIAADATFLVQPQTDATYSLEQRFVFFDYPVLTKLEPDSGSEDGGYTVYVDGTGFQNFEGPCTPFNRYDTQDCLVCAWYINGDTPELFYFDFGVFINSTRIACTAPSWDSGDVYVTISLNAQSVSSGLRFSYRSNHSDDWPTTQNIIVLSVVGGGCLIIIIGLIAGYFGYRYYQKKHGAYSQLESP